MSTAVVAALVILLVVASVAALSLYLGSRPRPNTTLAAGSGSSFNYDPSLGLNLTLSVGPIHAAQGIFLSINASIVNPSLAPIVLNSSNAPMRASPGPCSQLPLGVAILQGNYGVGNFSETTPLTTYYPGIFFCPAEFNIDRFSFAPQSEDVTAYVPEPQWTQPAVIRTHAWGFWNTSGGVRYHNLCPNCGYPGSFQSFPPGLYTALAQDQWGQVVVAHFEVTGNSALLSCSSVTSNNSFTEHPVGILSSGPFAVSSYYVDRAHNGSVFLPLRNDGSGLVTLVGIESPGHSIYNYQGNDFPPAYGAWYAETPGEPLEYPFSAPAGACTLLHMDFTGFSFPVGIELRFLFADNQNETIILKGS